jgi:hypothetical protein
LLEDVQFFIDRYAAEEIITVAYTKAQATWVSAFNYSGTNTSMIAGTNNGINACVAALQQILKNAGLPSIGNGTYNVDVFVNALRAGWTTTTGPANGSVGQSGPVASGTSHPVQGDIVVEGDGNAVQGQEHVGICENDGGSTIISNASYNYQGLQCAAACFGWEATPTEFQNGFYPVLPIGYYHLS